MEIIATHINADFDCIGAMVAALHLYPDARLVFPGSQEKGVREFLRRFDGLSLPIIRLKELEPLDVTRVILVDCSHTRRIGRLAEIIRRPEVEVDIFDHHPEDACDIPVHGGIIRPAGSTTTILCHILMERGTSLSPLEATTMLLGIHEDTGSFRFSSTTPDDLRAAAWLLEQGGEPAVVSRHLEQILTPQQLSLLNELVESARIITINGIDIALASSVVDDYPGEIAPLAHLMQEIKQWPALFIVVGVEDRVHVVARSSVAVVDVGVILSAVGGGGHPFAASATIRNRTHLQVVDEIEEAIRAMVKSETRAGEIMSSPVKTLESTVTLQEARDMLVRYNVNAMPVMDGGAMVGLITRRIVERALYHGITSAPVTDYMNVDFMRATPDTPVTQIRNYIIQHNRRFVPVFDGDRLVGVVTRTDVLRAGEISDGSLGEIPELHSLKGKNIRGLMEKSLPAGEIALLRRFGEIADRLDLPLYVVGGYVRDLLLGIPNKDVDLTVEGDGISFADAAAREMGLKVRSHEKFRTAVLIAPDGRTFDVASTRLEYYESPGALPVVEHSSLKMDLFRRDFTVNTLAICVNDHRFGDLIDYFGARRDLEERIIRVLHNLSFVEDPTRMFRAVRLEQRLGFRIAVHTERLIRNAVKMGFVSQVKGGRIMTELKLILMEKESLKSIERLEMFGLLAVIHPSLRVDESLVAWMKQGEDAIAWHSLMFPQKPVDYGAVRFLLLTHQLSDTDLKSVQERLGFPEREAERLVRTREALLKTVRRHERELVDGVTGSTLFRLFGTFPDEFLLYLMGVISRPEVRSSLIRVMAELKGLRREVTGDDLRSRGIPPGPLYATILEAVSMARMDGILKSRDDELRFVDRFLQERGGVLPS